MYRFMTGVACLFGLVVSASAQQGFRISRNDAGDTWRGRISDINDDSGDVDGLTYSKRHRDTTSELKWAAYEGCGVPQYGHRAPRSAVEIS